MRFQHKIGDHQVVAYCPESLASQVAELFKSLSALNEKGPALGDGMIIRFGWSDLKLSLYGDELVLMEPDFSSNPLRDYLPQVTVTLEVLTEQVTLLKRLSVSTLDINYRQDVIIAKGCLQKSNIYLERTETKEKDDSGWFIGETEVDYAEDDLEAIYVFEIYQRRKELMQFLILPPQYLVVINNNHTEAILNSANENVLNR